MLTASGAHFLPALPPKLYLEDGQGQDLMPNHGWWKGTRVAANFVGCAGSSVRKEEERGGSDGGWPKAVSSSINGLFDSCISIYTFCLRPSDIPPSSNCHEKCIAPPTPHQSCNRILSGCFSPPLFQSISLTSSLSAHSLLLLSTAT